VWIGLDVLRPIPGSPTLPRATVLAEPRHFQLPIGRQTEPVVAARWLRRLATLLCVLVALTIMAGGFVAGTRAGFDYNSFPLMAGHLVPTGYARLSPFIRNLTENIAAVQFDHRFLATLTALVGATIVTVGVSTPSLRPVRGLVLALATVVAVQYVLGVTTLLLVVPVGLAAAHQAVAVLVLTAALAMLHALRGAA
jgi:cytochrome c oxidase assembly protein subunit 15